MNSRWGLEVGTAAGFISSTYPPADGLHCPASQVYGGERCQDAQVWLQVSSLLTNLSLPPPIHVVWLILGVFRFKVSGELPLLHIKISDQKIQNILDLVDSIPLPNMGSSPSTPTKKVDLVQPDTTVATPTEINTPFRRWNCHWAFCNKSKCSWSVSLWRV